MHSHHFEMASTNPRCLISFFQGRRTSERFVKPAIPTTSLGLNTSAPNILSHHSGLLGVLGSGGGTGANIGQHHSVNTLSTPMASAHGSNSNSLNSSSLSSSSTHTLPNTNNSNSSLSFAGHSAFTQPASPMDTSVYKD